MRRLLRSTGLFLALAGVLAGCMKIDEDLTVRSDGKIDGTAIIAFSKDFVTMMEGMSSGLDSGSKSTKKQESFEDQLRHPDPITDLPKGASAKSTFYKQGDWVGNKITFKGMPADKLASLDATTGAATGDSSNDSQQFSLTKEGANWHFRMVMDMTSETGDSATTVKGKAGKATPTTEAFDMSAMMGAMKAEIRIKVTFPGKVIKANGKVSGNSVTWTPEFGKKVVMDAVAKA